MLRVYVGAGHVTGTHGYAETCNDEGNSIGSNLNTEMLFSCCDQYFACRIMSTSD